MSDLSQEAMRKAVEEKKRKLEELKAKRAARTTPSSSSSVHASPLEDKAEETSTSSRTTVSVDAILNSVSSLLPTQTTPTTTTPTTSTTTTTTTSVPRKIQLTVTAQPPISIPPVERIAYDVGMQTDPPPLMEKDGIAPADAVARLRQIETERSAEQISWQQKEIELTRQLEQLLEEKKKLQADQNPTPLSAADQGSILSSSSFLTFFKHASLVMERALDSGSKTYDYTVDYSQDEAKDASTSSESRVIARHHFHDISRTSSRPVTSLHWSPKYKELLLASYAGHEDELSTEPDGTVLVWNLHMSKRPEYYFSCQSAVLSAQFHPTEARHIIGGTASGQLVMWDTREKSTPVNRSSLSYGHTHPIFALNIITLVNGLHQIVSVSTDGHLCVWNDANLHKPQHEIYLKVGKDEVTTNSFDFPGRDTQTVVLGSDEGNIYKAHIYDKDNVYETIQAHDAPITSLEFHPAHRSTHSPAHLSDLFLTASYDWTVKLWSNKLQRPLYTFESAKDYVYDVKWSPKNPALFAMGDGTGRIDFWNLLTDTEVPYHTVQLDDSALTSSTVIAAPVVNINTSVGVPPTTTVPRDQPSAVSKLKWSDDGTQLAVGTSSGGVHIYEVQSDMSNPNRDEMNGFYDKIGKRAMAGV